MKLGVISDTHNFFDPQIPKCFAGVDHILHAGDIGSQSILGRLHQIAPVTAIRGNTDDPALNYPLSVVRELGGCRFFLHHIINPRALSESVQATLRECRPDVVVFGHSHKPFAETIGAVLFFNPGYAGRSRFGLARTIAVLSLDGQKIQHEFVRL